MHTVLKALMTGVAVTAMVAAAPTLAKTAAKADPLKATGAWSAYTAGKAATPPMGWSSWNAFHTDITEDKVMASAKTIVDSGLAAKGYRYIDLDDGWWLKRRLSDGRMIIRTKLFPSAATGGAEETSFRPFTDRIHAMGLKAGIYSDIGRNNCSQAFGGPNAVNLPEGTPEEREVGLYGHTDQDIALYFKDWNFDLIKVDGCGVRAFGPDQPDVKSGLYRPLVPLIDVKEINRTNIAEVRRLYTQVADDLKRDNPDGDYIFSICAWGSADVRAWGKNVGNISRTSDDLTPKWTRMLANFDSAATRSLYAHPGTWNDPDMLFIGHGDFDETHLTEARSHFALWAMIDAPLLIGYDLRNAPQSLMDIFGNSDIIAIDQDPAGNQAVLAYDSEDVQIFVKSLSTGGKAVAIFNRGLAPAEVTLTAEQMKYAKDKDIVLTDLWTKAKTTVHGEGKFQVDPRQTLIFAADGTRALPNGVYLSEIPGSVNPAVDGVTVPQPDPAVHRMSNPWGDTRGSGERPAYTGWGGAQADSTPYGQALEISGKVFDSGLSVLANSRFEVRNAGYSRFTAKVGVDDSTIDAASSVTFSIYGDGKLLATSKPVRFGQTALDVSANVAGVKIIELVARSSAPAKAMPTVVTWGDAALLK